jgi:hypothetical protein
MRHQIKSPLLNSIILLEQLSKNGSVCRELPFCPVGRIRAALRMPGAAGPYRGIRANMEQASMRTGLDHCAGTSETQPGEAMVIVGQRYRRLARRNVVPAIGVWQELPTRFVIPAGSALVDLGAWTRIVLGSGGDVPAERLPRPWACWVAAGLEQKPGGHWRLGFGVPQVHAVRARSSAGCCSRAAAPARSPGRACRAR